VSLSNRSQGKAMRASVGFSARFVWYCIDGNDF